MADDRTRAILMEILAGLDLPADKAQAISFRDDDRLPSCYPVTELAAASIGAAGLAMSQLIGHFAEPPEVKVSHRLASLWFGWSIQPIGWQMPSPWDAIAGDYPTKDGWIKIHTNAPHHNAAALGVLKCASDRQAVADAIAHWSADALEAAIEANGGCAATLRSAQDWRAHPQGTAVAQEPLMIWAAHSTSALLDWQPSAQRPLAGLRVLDLTRVLAGPVATRFLAGFGADVLRIDPPTWDEPSVVPEVTLGKRCAHLDLKTPDGRGTFESLLGKADMLIHSYRGDALEALGFGPEARQAIRPGLIDISLNAYGHSGPCAKRRGFDSLVQFSTGIASAGMAWRAADKPVSLPVQALDHATGYLLAAAAVRAVSASLTKDGSIRARLSLARTAKLLIDHQDGPTQTDISPVTDNDINTVIEDTDWGPARRLLPPLSIQGAAMHWDRPATRLGSAIAAW